MLAKQLFPESLLQRLRSFRFRNKIIVLMYHDVLEDTNSCIAWTIVKESEFIRQLRYLREHFNILSLEEAFSIMERGVVPGKPCAVLTFDDGYAGNRRVVLPNIERLKIPITVFVSTKAIQDQKPYWYDLVIRRLEENKNSAISLDLDKFGLGLRVFKKNLCGQNRWDRVNKLLTDLKAKLPEERNEIVQCILEQTTQMNSNTKQLLMPMTVSDISEMATSKLVTFGAHSHSHDILTQLDTETVLKNIVTSKELLAAWTGKSIDFFAYPNGDFNHDTISAVEQSGFIAAFSTKPYLWSKSDTIFALPRIGIGRFDSLANFKLKVSGLPA